MSSRVCQHCGCSDIDTDAARGDAVCTNCGSVLEDQIIVSEVQFQENSIGGTSVIGQYVSAEGNKSHSMGSGFHHGFGKESRAVTLQNGKKNIQQLASQLKLNQHCIEIAYNFFKMAVSKRLTRGRKTKHVIAACLYLVCRTEGTPHMLLDFSDILQVNVYTLGKTYLHLSRELCINVPAIDPCLLIQRFSHKLDFEEKTHDVSMTALRIVQRMKRDWMATGRRPSGLCGAALFVASRIHECYRTMKDIIKVVKVCEATLRKRLTEFEDTPTSELTIDEFQRIDLEEEQDPPSFKQSRRKAKEQAALEESGKLSEVVSEVSNIQKEIEQALEAKMKKRWGKEIAKGEVVQESSSQQQQSKDPNNTAENEELSQCSSIISDDTLEAVLNDPTITSDSGISEMEDITSSEPVTDISEDTMDSTDADVQNLEKEELDSLLMPPPTNLTPGQKLASLRPTAASLGLMESVQECMKDVNEIAKGEDGKIQDDGELDLDGIDDEELEKFILNEEEVKRKTAIWIKLNAVYIQEQQEKAEKEAREKELGITKPEPKKRKQNKKKKQQYPASSAEEAIQKMLHEKKFSNKINYEVLKDLNRVSETKQVITAEPILGATLPTKSVLGTPDSKRFRRTSLPLDSNTVEQSQTGPPVKKIKSEDSQPASAVIVESGPVDYAKDEEDVEEEFEEEEEEDEEHISAAALLGHGREIEDYHDGYDVDDMD